MFIEGLPHAVTKREGKRIRALRRERAAAKQCNDPLPISHRLEIYKRYIKPARVEKQRLDAIRADLLRAARVARKMGLIVKSSKSRNGNISSYYVQREFRGKRIRISDHDIPWTHTRDARTDGNFDGSADIYAAADPIRRNIWWQRAITLALAGREVPGGV